MRKKMAAFLLVFAMCLSFGIVVPVMAEETTSSGKCGDNLTWVLDDGTLTISGTGDMYDYWDIEDIWTGYEIEKIVIEDGVTSIGESAFSWTCVVSVSIPDSVTRIGAGAFTGDSYLESITIPNGVTTIEDSTFCLCESLTTIEIPKSVTRIGAEVFNFCESLTSVAFLGDAPEIDENAFHYRTVTAYYPANNDTWTEDVRKDYGGEITWEAYDDTVTFLSTCTVSLSTTSYTYNGKAKTPTVTVKDASGNTVSSSNYTVTYSNNTNAGTATVKVTGTGSYTGTVTKTFTIAKASQTVTATAKSSSIKAGKTTTITASGKGTITYSSSDTSVATVSSSGKVTGKGVGTATITVKAAGNSNYKSATKKVTIKVGLSTPSISSVKQSNKTVTVKWAQITGAKGYYVYRSTSKSSGYSLVKTITAGSTVSYSDTASKTGGKTYYYKVVAYSGNTKSSESAVKSLKYMKGSVSGLTNTSSGITVKWAQVSNATGYYIYRKAGSGSYKKVNTITSASTTSWKDTSVKSSNGTTYTYYVQPYNSSSKGAYATKKTVRMTAVSISSLTNSSSKKMTVKWAKNTKATGYQIQYSKSSSFSSGNQTVTVSGASKVSTIISSLTKDKTYYVRVRAYKTISGTKYYSAWSSKKSVKISK